MSWNVIDPAVGARNKRTEHIPDIPCPCFMCNIVQPLCWCVQEAQHTVCTVHCMWLYCKKEVFKYVSDSILAGQKHIWFNEFTPNESEKCLVVSGNRAMHHCDFKQQAELKGEKDKIT